MAAQIVKSQFVTLGPNRAQILQLAPPTSSNSYDNETVATGISNIQFAMWLPEGIASQHGSCTFSNGVVTIGNTNFMVTAGRSPVVIVIGG